MTSPAPPSAHRAPLLLAIGTAALVLLSSAGCENLRPFFEQTRSAVMGGATPACPRVRLGDFRGGVLCDRNGCEQCVRVDLAEGGRLRVDLFAPSDHPATRVRVVDARGRERAQGRWTRSRKPTVLRQALERGRYEIHLEALASNTQHVPYDLKVGIDDSHASPAARTRRPAAAAPKRVPTADEATAHNRAAAAPEPPETPAATTAEDALDAGEGADEGEGAAAGEATASAVEPAEAPPCSAETFIAFLEEADATSPVAVLANGRDIGLAPGAHGKLLRDGVQIGSVEIIEMLPSGSRARFLETPAEGIDEETIDALDICFESR